MTEPTLPRCFKRTLLLALIGLAGLSACSKKPAEDASKDSPVAPATPEPSTAAAPAPAVVNAARDPAVLPLLKAMAGLAEGRFDQACTRQMGDGPPGTDGAGPMALTAEATLTWPGGEPLDWLNRATATVSLGYDAKQKAAFLDLQWPETTGGQPRWIARAVNQPGAPYALSLQDTGSQPAVTATCQSGSGLSLGAETLWQLLAKHMGSAKASLNCFGTGSSTTQKQMDVLFESEAVTFGDYRAPVAEVTAQSAVLAVDPNSAAELGLVRYSMDLGATADPTMLGFAADKSLVAASFHDPKAQQRWTCMRPR